MRASWLTVGAALLCTVSTASCFDWDHIGVVFQDAGGPTGESNSPGTPEGMQGSVNGDFSCSTPHVLVPVQRYQGPKQLWRFALQPGSMDQWRACATLPVWGPPLINNQPLSAAAGIHNTYVVAFGSGVTRYSATDHVLDGKYQEVLASDATPRTLFPLRIPGGVGTEAQQTAQFGLSYTDSSVSPPALAGLALLTEQGALIERNRLGSSDLIPAAIRAGIGLMALTTDAYDNSIVIGVRLDMNFLLAGQWGSNAMVVGSHMGNPRRFVTIGSAPGTDGRTNVALTVDTLADGVFYQRDVFGGPLRCDGCREFLSAVPHPSVVGQYLMACKTTDGVGVFHYGNSSACTTVKTFNTGTLIGQLSLVLE